MICRILSCGMSATAVGSLFLAAACGGAASQASLRHVQSESGVVARVGEREITLDQVDERARRSNMSAYQALYEARRSAIEEMIDETLLEQEARSRGVSTDELVSREIETKIAEVTEEDVQTFYVQNQARLHGQTLEQIGGQIREFLAARNEASARESYLAVLRGRTSVAVSLEPPRVPLAVESGERVKGPWDAPVTIVEYSDFQCPFCARVGPTMARIEETYGDKVKLVYRDFPLPNHPEAQSAAEAARCAHEQGKFWPYHDRLFANQQTLSSESYRRLAVEVGLDPGAFEDCVASGKFREAVQEDYRNGESMGVGALDAGLSEASGELIAVFDADFVPGSSFLQETVHYFADPGVGMVQARWGHVNADYSTLTRVQALLLDAHFVLEHGGRNRAGCFFNFNGTAGLWRRRCIEEAGGWQHDTLTEDMDLSYRAPLEGWRFVFLPDVVVPAELPVSMNAFKSQQHRWSKGSIQTARKLLPKILASPLPRTVKLESLFHLTANVSYPLMVLLSLLMFPSMILRFDMGVSEMLLVDLPLFFLATASVTSFYVVSQRELYTDWKGRLRVLPVLLSLGIGMCLNNARAVLEALLGRETEFVRTPKYGIESSDEEWRLKKYRGLASFLPLLEVGLGLYFTATVAYAPAGGSTGRFRFSCCSRQGSSTPEFSRSGSGSSSGPQGSGKPRKAPSSSPAKTGPRSCLGRLIRRAVSLG